MLDKQTKKALVKQFEYQTEQLEVCQMELEGLRAAIHKTNDAREVNTLLKLSHIECVHCLDIQEDRINTLIMMLGKAGVLDNMEDLKND